MEEGPARARLGTDSRGGKKSSKSCPKEHHLDAEADESLEKSSTATAEQGKGWAEPSGVFSAPQNPLTGLKQLQALLGTQLGPSRAGQALLSCQGPAIPGVCRDFHPGPAGSAE